MLRTRITLWRQLVAEPTLHSSLLGAGGGGATAVQESGCTCSLREFYSCVHFFSVEWSCQYFFKKLNWLGWHRFIKIYKFQGYNPMTHFLYIVLCVHQLSPVSLHHSPILSGNQHTVVYKHFFFFCLIPFHLAPLTPFLLTVVSLFSVSASLSLFYLLVHLVH